MRKILTFLFAALMSVGMWADPIVVTWNDPSGSGFEFTQDGVTLTCGNIDNIDFYGPGTFTTDLGNFKKIEVYAESGCYFNGDRWKGDVNQKIWTGKAASVSFSDDIYAPTRIVFTIEPATVAVTGVTLNQNEAQMTVGGETLTLTATVNPEGATDKSVTWSTSDGNVATVENGVVTAVAAGTATITVTTTDGSFTATCAVTVAAPAEPVASWVGKSAINANGTWYYAGSNFGWCTGGAFNGADLGTITELSLGGQSQAWAEGSANWNDENLTMTMGYKIDDGEAQYLDLTWYQFADNNNFFQSGGNSWAPQDIDISGLTPGNHTIAVWFRSAGFAILRK